MKKDIHPNMHPVIFVDTSCGAEFVTLTTRTGEQTRMVDGVEYQVVDMEISSASHPFFTGEERFLDSGGRVEKFQAKQAKVGQKATERKGKKVKRAARAKTKTIETKPAKKEK